MRKETKRVGEDGKAVMDGGAVRGAWQSGRISVVFMNGLRCVGGRGAGAPSLLSDVTPVQVCSV